MQSLEDFGEFLLVCGFITFPLITSLLTRFLTKRPLPRPNAFVITCGAIVYGLVTIGSLAGVLFNLANGFFGAYLAYKGHSRLFEVSLLIRDYGYPLVGVVMLVLSCLVPLRVVRSWASLVAAWG